MSNGLHSVMWSYFVCALVSTVVYAALAWLPRRVFASLLVVLPLASALCVLRGKPGNAAERASEAERACPDAATDKSRRADIVAIAAVVAISTAASQVIRMECLQPGLGESIGLLLLVTLIPPVLTAAFATAVAAYAYAFHTSSIFYLAVPAATAPAYQSNASPTLSAQSRSRVMLERQPLCRISSSRMSCLYSSLPRPQLSAMILEPMTAYSPERV